MAEETATFGIEMVDGVSEPAESAATALAKLQDSIKADTKALAEMQRTLNQLKKATNPNTEQIGKLEKSIAQVNARITQSKEKFIAQGGQFGKNYKGAKQFREKMDELAKAASTLPGPFGGVVSTLARLANAKNLARIAAFALAGAVLAIGIAAVTSAKHLADFAIAAQEARRNELLMLEASTKLPTVMGMAFGLARNNAKDLQSAVDQVAASVTVGRDEVAKYAAQLDKMGVRGKNIAPALRAVSMAASGWGEERATQTAAWAAQLALTGGSVEKLAQRVKNQIGGVVAQKMKSSEVQARKLAESYNSLFGDVDISGLLDARKAFNDLFSQSTNSGRALRQMLGTITQPLVDSLTALSRIFKLVVQNIIIGLLQAQIAWLRLQLGFRAGVEVLGRDFAALKQKLVNEFTAIADGFKAAVDRVLEYSDLLTAAVTVAAAKWLYKMAPAIWANVLAMGAYAKQQGLALARMAKELPAAIAGTTKALLASGLAALQTAARFLIGLIPAIITATVGFWNMAVAVFAATWPFVLAVVAVWAFIKLLRFLWDWSMSVKWEDIGASIWEGITGWLSGAKEWFANSFKSLAEAGANAFKKVFGIASPSKLMKEYGKNITAGLTLGVEDGAPDAAASIAAAGGDPAAAVPAGAAARVGGSTTVSIATLNVEVGGNASTEDARGIAQAVKRELESILETVAVQTGASFA
jgi:TolA-binding protein